MLDGTAAAGVHRAVIEALTVPDRNRSDAAEAMIRLEHSRERFAGLPLPEVGGQPRPAGSVTVQLASAGRYCGDVAIALRDLPADSRVAVLGFLSSPDCAPGVRPSRPCSSEGLITRCRSSARRAGGASVTSA
ncbi:phospho-sugar glycosidase domain-containing protein [Curtobacterium sp. MCLR17_044]|uniref:phospho-sugar glycosidase domain-containing protein n=1 Tax=Curtobacterium sp. MCLR17_044 TaxID=2175628 RepID=UPI0035C90354